MLSRRTRIAGFTLIELLTVIVIIGIIAAILLPGLNSSRAAAAKAQTRVQFAQWAAAIVAFRQEYGAYPAFDASGLVNADATTNPAAPHLFHDLLAGRRRDGSPLPDAAGADPRSPEAQNRRRMAFYSFGPAEIASDHRLQDASGNTDIAVLVDRNLDGLIDGRDYPGGWPAVAGIRPGATDIPPAGLRLGVAFYAPAPGATAEQPAFVVSW